MDSKPNSLALVFGATVISAVALFFGTGLHPIWWLTWIAPVPVLLVAPRLSWQATFGVALAAWAAGGLNEWTYMHAVVPPAIAVVAVLFPAVVFAIDVLLYRRFLQPSLWRGVVIFPVFWVCYEFVFEQLWPHGTWGNISYAQMNALPVLQIVSITGILGISFSLFLFAATLAAILDTSAGRLEKIKLALVVATVLGGVLGFGVWRLHVTPSGRPVKVGLIASDVRKDLFTEDRDNTLRVLGEYATQARDLASQGAQVIVIPEKLGVVLDSYLADVDAIFRNIATQTGVPIVVGILRPTPEGKWNEARLYLPDGTIDTYEKHHMLPAFESQLRPGTTRTEWQEPSGRWGIAICKDMDFPRLSREYGNDGTGLLLVPAWDFDADGWLHGRMAILRGVESGFSIARAPRQGILTVTDDRGRVLAERETNAAPFSTLVATVPVRHDSTLYARVGDWFGWLNLAALIVLTGSGLISRRTLSERNVKGLQERVTANR